MARRNKYVRTHSACIVIHVNFVRATRDNQDILYKANKNPKKTINLGLYVPRSCICEFCARHAVISDISGGWHDDNGGQAECAKNNKQTEKQWFNMFYPFALE